MFVISLKEDWLGERAQSVHICTPGLLVEDLKCFTSCKSQEALKGHFRLLVSRSLAAMHIIVTYSIYIVGIRLSVSHAWNRSSVSNNQGGSILGDLKISSAMYFCVSSTICTCSIPSVRYFCAQSTVPKMVLFTGCFF